MPKTKRAGFGAVLAAVSLAVGGIAIGAPATASTNAEVTGDVAARAVLSASGTQTCPAGRHVYVRATLSSPGTLTYYTSRGRIHQAYASFHYWTYPGDGGQTLNWRITSDVNIEEVADGCTTN